MTERRWRQVLDDGGRFLGRWAHQAASLGWSAVEVFGVQPQALERPVHLQGLIWLLEGRRVVAVMRDSATSRHPVDMAACRTRSVIGAPLLLAPEPVADPSPDCLGAALRRTGFVHGNQALLWRRPTPC